METDARPPGNDSPTGEDAGSEGLVVGTMIVCAVLGMLVAVVGSFVQAYVWFGFHSGVFVALSASAIVFLSCGWAASHRRGALCASAAWIVTTYFLSSWSRPEGDVIFVDAWPSQVWIYGGAVVALIMALLPYHLFGYEARGRAQGERRPLLADQPER